MLKLRFLNYIVLLLLSINAVNAAAIHGTIYDLSLKKINNARVEINTSPKQFLVAQNGTYAFNAPNGIYSIKAQLMQKSTVIASVQENITIRQQGDYVLDLILFPDVEEGVEDIEIDVNGDVVEAGKRKDLMFGLVFVLVGGVLIAFTYLKKYKKQKNEILKEETKTEQRESKETYENTDLSQITDIIKKEGGRATQKDIRKQIPLSEAKISLMIAELEHKGVVEKIKKGRGNIIILKKK